MEGKPNDNKAIDFNFLLYFSAFMKKKKVFVDKKIEKAGIFNLGL